MIPRQYDRNFFTKYDMTSNDVEDDFVTSVAFQFPFHHHHTTVHVIVIMHTFL